MAAQAQDSRAMWLSWTTLMPVLAVVVLGVSWGRHPAPVWAAVVVVVLVGAVLAAVHHAEVVAHRVGEPFGSLILAVAVTVIEVALIVTLMVSGEQGHLGAGPRHRLRRGDDQRQRHRRPLAAGRRAAKHRRWRCSTPRAPARRWPPWPPSPTLTLVLPRFTTTAAGPGVLARASSPSPRSPRCSLYADVRLHPDRPAPRLLPAGRAASTASPTTTTTATPTRRPTGRR